jgi:hypothetical protein
MYIKPKRAEVKQQKIIPLGALIEALRVSSVICPAPS